MKRTAAIRFHSAAIVAILLFAAVTGRAQQPQANRTNDPSARGVLKSTFATRSPLSKPAELAKRLGLTSAPADYDLTKHEFLIYIPENYDPSKPYGVLLLLHYNNLVIDRPPHETFELLSEKRIIFIIRSSGSALSLAEECGVTLDAIENLKERYNIDADRVYAWAMEREEFAPYKIALSSPDVFKGVGFRGWAAWEPVPMATGTRKWNPRFEPPIPSARMLAMWKTQPICLMLDGTGNTREIGHLWAKWLKSAGYRYVSTKDVVGEDLHYPHFTAAFMKDVLEFFESSASAERAQAKPPSTGPASGAAPSPSTRPSAPAPTEAARMLKLAESYIKAGSYGQARTRLTAIVEKFPTSPEAQRAKVLLKEIQNK